MPRKYDLIAVAVCLAAVAAAAEPAPRVLRTAAEIAAEVTLPDAKPARVVFEGCVAYQDPMRSTFFADETGVTFIFGGTNPIVQPGDLVRVTGVAHQGVIIGGIKPEKIEVLGRGDPPPATPIGPADLATGRYHYHRVVLEGVIRGVAPAGDSAVVLMLSAAGKPARIEAEAAATEAPAAAARLIDARVRVTGFVVGNINDRRQVVDPYVRIKRLADVEVRQRRTYTCGELAAFGESSELVGETPGGQGCGSDSEGVSQLVEGLGGRIASVTVFARKPSTNA